MSKWILLFISGGIGTIARYALAGTVYQWAGSRFPYGTLAVNLVGCFLAGILIVLSEEKFLLNPTFRLMMILGFLGGFTTFSSFIVETANLIRDGESLLALGNVLLSVCVGFVVFQLGVLIGKIL